jgi:hypothetical protein
MGVFQIFAGWWGHQPGQTAVVGVLTDHNQNEVRKFEMQPYTFILVQGIFIKLSVIKT